MPPLRRCPTPLRSAWLAAALLGLALPTWAQAPQKALAPAPQPTPGLTVVNFGGASGIAQKKAYFDAYEKATGTPVTQVEYHGEQAPIQAMVQAGRVTWDVVEVEGPDLHRGCAAGLFEHLDWSQLGAQADFMPEAIHPCGVGSFVWATVLAYDADKLKHAPQGWSDFWDVQRYPGQRGLRKGARYNLEFALMADGVPPGDVYRVLQTAQGTDRAFNKLSALKAHIRWWEDGDLPVQLLASGDVTMSSAFSGRIHTAQRAGQQLQISWSGSIFDLDFWAMPKGGRNAQAALQFIALASSPQTQAAYARHIAYGPTNIQALTLLEVKVLEQLPTAPANSKNALWFDAAFWAQHGAALEQRFGAWLLH